MTNLTNELKKPFDPKIVKWRIGQSGKKANGYWAKVLAYVDSRDVMKRLDDVMGAENWKTEVTVLGDGVLCKLSLRIDGEWITKEDGAEFTNVEGFKGGISKALVRSANLWGIGRYFYYLKDSWAIVSDKKSAQTPNYAKTKDGVFYWGPPELPDWALPKASINNDAVEKAIVEAFPGAKKL